jgi:hypothetical protein
MSKVHDESPVACVTAACGATDACKGRSLVKSLIDVAALETPA